MPTCRIAQAPGNWGALRLLPTSGFLDGFPTFLRSLGSTQSISSGCWVSMLHSSWRRSAGRRRPPLGRMKTPTPARLSMVALGGLRAAAWSGTGGMCACCHGLVDGWGAHTATKDLAGGTVPGRRQGFCAAWGQCSALLTLCCCEHGVC